MTQPDISLATKSGHFDLLRTCIAGQGEFQPATHPTRKKRQQIRAHPRNRNASSVRLPIAPVRCDDAESIRQALRANRAITGEIVARIW
jgi:hypothetical protein